MNLNPLGKGIEIRVTHLTETFKRLFECLHEVGYAWEPLAPDWLLRSRKLPDQYSALVRFFGLGLPVSELELIAEGVSSDLIDQVFLLRPAISSYGSLFIPHHHWPANPERPDHYIYFGQESLRLTQCIQPYLERFVGRKVLDLGCGAGALSFEVASLAQQVVGMDCSNEAIQWARAAAEAQKIRNVRFEELKIGSAGAEVWMEQQKIRFDRCIFNPPMTIPRVGSVNPHRDGGCLGIEIPLNFLKFAYSYLEADGEVYCLVTNPIIHGRPMFFDELDSSKWSIQEMICLNHHFNQSLHREDHYRELGITRIELWFLLLRKAGRK